MSEWADDELRDLKVFFQKYGRVLVYGGLALLLVGVGVFTYRHYEARRGILAAGLYDEMLGATTQARWSLALAAGHKLEHDYAGTPYAGQAALLLARVDYEQKHPSAAIADLRFAARHGHGWSVRTIARLRLAGLLLALGHPHKAWPYAHLKKPYGFEGQALALQAGIRAREGHERRAYRLYTEALKHVPKKSVFAALWHRLRSQLQETS